MVAAPDDRKDVALDGRPVVVDLLPGEPDHQIPLRQMHAVVAAIALIGLEIGVMGDRIAFDDESVADEDVDPTPAPHPHLDLQSHAQCAQPQPHHRLRARLGLAAHEVEPAAAAARSVCRPGAQLLERGEPPVDE
ncbi:hypothetical protein [Agrococcus sp. ARC_14]|uniref:hypothetical protein n=1 Tax=Agrococcus sp. ARC_14 TaxID=2919927 RepID=UPI001F06343B|nr:hypothetical protein [Agrococcus sp. ARC_14]MCH1882282.1 hypothetical protein [Agrococcus sp. ARC_14]